jgi:hypothetical protein
MQTGRRRKRRIRRITRRKVKIRKEDEKKILRGRARAERRQRKLIITELNEKEALEMKKIKKAEKN